MSFVEQPLAERLRPKSIEQYFGQSHLLGKNGLLKRMLDSKIVTSMILWGPPGTGKTTLARLIAENANIEFHSLSAISSGVKDIREVIDRAKLFHKSVLFIDEIHRFSKSQQDALLGAVENGTIRLIGATTENPSFEVNNALLSRCQVYVLQPFSESELKQIIHRAVSEDEILKTHQFDFQEYDALLQLSSGDGRKLLNLLELIFINHTGENTICVTNELVLSLVEKNVSYYDKNADMHYDVVSAFIKFIRGSDPNAAVYWLARMIEGGEDPKFIARRMLILSSEDIGNANPTALIMANNCFQAVNVIGYPEARIILSQTAIYLASSPKSNASYEAINKAQQLVQQTGHVQIPLHLRGAYTSLNKKLGYGKDYLYAHDYEGSFVKQEYFPKELSKTVLYNPKPNPREEELRKYLRSKWNDKYGY